MPDTFTTNFNWTKPEVGLSTSTWGIKLNSNLDDIDTKLKLATDTANASLARAGGTMTGGLTITTGGLTVTGATNVTGAIVQSGNAGIWATGNGGSAGSGAFYLGNTGSRYLSCDGTNYSLGGTAATNNLYISGEQAATRVWVDGNYLKLVGGTMSGPLTISYSSTNLVLNRPDNGVSQITLQTASATRGTIGANTSYPFYVTNAGGTALLYVDNSGNTTSYANVTAYSDERLKTDIQVIDNALDKVCSLLGVTYTRNDPRPNSAQFNGRSEIGVVAQNVQQVFPQAVLSNPDGYLSVAYPNLIGPLIEAVKELKASQDAIKARLDALEQR